MNIESFARQDGRFVRKYEYGDRVTVVADVGLGDSDASVDVVDDTAIVVTGTGDGESQFELDLPAAPARAFINNGILTIEMEAANE